MQRLNLPLVSQELPFTCGAACFASMVQFLTGVNLGELHFAKELGTLELGYTPPENYHQLVKHFGLKSDFKVGATLADLEEAFTRRRVIAVTWWDEDAGHYSLIEELNDEHVTLMDPLTAKEGKWNQLGLEFFEKCWRERGSKMIAAGS